MRNCTEIFIMAALLAGLSSCNGTASLSGSIDPMPSKGTVLTLRRSAPSGMETVDSAAVKSDGSFRFRIPVPAGQPEFHYLYLVDKKLSSLILEGGSRIKLQCDTSGNWKVTGSAQCDSLAVWEKEYSSFIRGKSITLSEYLAFYRRMVKFIMGNSGTVCVVPALMCKVGGQPLFGRGSDAFLFGTAADSLETAYPESRYVRILRAEQQKLSRQMDIEEKFSSAGNCIFPDMTYPDINGQPRSLSQSTGTKTVLVFWNPSSASDKLMNMDVLKPLYEKYSGQGMKIYAVGLGPDKASWASVVRSQNMKWTNVFDASGTSIALYALRSVPAFFVITDERIHRMDGISELEKTLK